MRRSVVCGVDASSGSRAALRVAARLAGELGVRLVVAHVIQPRPTAGRFAPDMGQSTSLPLDALRASGEILIDRMLDEEHLSDVERRVTLGFAADRLADVADAEDAEVIVVGSRGRPPVRAALFGSVTADLMGVARCPVLVVPPAAAAEWPVGSMEALGVLRSGSPS